MRCISGCHQLQQLLPDEQACLPAAHACSAHALRAPCRGQGRAAGQQCQGGGDLERGAGVRALRHGRDPGSLPPPLLHPTTATTTATTAATTTTVATAAAASTPCGTLGVLTYDSDMCVVVLGSAAIVKYFGSTCTCNKKKRIHLVSIVQ